MLYSYTSDYPQLMSRLVNRSLTDVMNWRNSSIIPNPTIPINIKELDDSYTVEAFLPGFKPEDISATIDEKCLTIEAQSEEQHNYVSQERTYSRVKRVVSLADRVDANKVEKPVLENGVLKIQIPKHEGSKPRQLEIG